MFVKKGNTYTPIDASGLQEFLPPGIYTLFYNDHAAQFFIVKKEDFTIGGKLYGNPQKDVDKVLKTYQHMKGNLGVLLFGTKGSGKTLTARMMAMQSNLPVLIVNMPLFGDLFNEFLAGLKQDVCFLFDEFEKVYNLQEQQQGLLTILDGTFNRKFLFLFTANEDNINYYFKNRLSRIRYKFDYHHLELPVINEIIDDRLTNKAHKEGLIKILEVIDGVNIDMLMHIIHEMNLHELEAREAVKDLNVSMDPLEYDVKLYFNKHPIQLNYEVAQGNPLTYEEFYVETRLTYEEPELVEINYSSVKLKDFDFQKIKDTYIYSKGSIELVFRKKTPSHLIDFLR